jgi:Ni/Fe-hydrogenase 1 B-type cytochrome subunit
MSGIKRVLIWGGWLRASHACIAFSVPVMLVTGWLIADSPSLSDLALDLHYLGAAVLLSGLIARAVLLVAGRDNERWQALVPANTELSAIVATLRCYISFGRMALPAWYAHNPLWKPLYLLTYLALVMLMATGAAMPKVSIALGFYVPDVHAFWAQVMLWLTVLHIASSILHDYKNQAADVSAMINGFRVFQVDGSRGDGPESRVHQAVSVDSIRKGN